MLDLSWNVFSFWFWCFLTCPGGYITVAQILRLHQYRQYTEEDVKRVVKTCPLQRYSLKMEPQSGQLQIRANFGHSMKVCFAKVSGTRESCVTYVMMMLGHSNKMFSFCLVATRALMWAGGLLLLLLQTWSAVEVLLKYRKWVWSVSKEHEVIFCHT